MIKCLILFLIFAGISTKESISSGIQFDVDVPFDKQNNEFSFDYTEDNAYFFIMIETGDILKYEVICTSQDTISGNVVDSVGYDSHESGEGTFKPSLVSKFFELTFPLVKSNVWYTVTKHS